MPPLGADLAVTVLAPAVPAPWWSSTLLILGTTVLFLGLAVGVMSLRAQARFRRMGFRVYPTGRQGLTYEEVDGRGGRRQLQLGGELLVGTPSVVYVPNANAWAHRVPDWARDRRDEIVARAMSEFGAQFTFEEYALEQPAEGSAGAAQQSHEPDRARG
jgi:hypothetical protein